jgi:Flp pilus assembly protein TadD, contains TPR repeats
MRLTPEPKPKRYRKYLNRWMIGGAIAAVLIIATVITVTLLNHYNDKVHLTSVGREYQKQLPDLKKKVDQNPNDATAHKNYGIALYATKNYKDAATQYEKAVELNPKDSVAYNNLGNTYRDLEQTDKAIDAYKKAIDLNPKSLNTYANLANIQLYTKDKPQDAIATYKQGLKALPKSSQLEFLLGIAYEQSGDKENAKTTYEHILSYDESNKAAQAKLNEITKQ